ncbi:hypothetical protein [Kibdelosporangium aridum]|uniref:hypothetical protein n=1 Tax=Kibdelosporangium aridum TaxID=2030 RepID=UPI0035EE09DA
MADDRHHSGFDQDEFERYDTFDAPVSDQTNPGREGLFGDLGRLFDQIRIDNAANKLDDNVSLGEDRVITESGNWAGVPHRQLYESVHTNNNPAEAYALAKEWTDLGNMMAENSRAMDEAIRSTESGWTGVGAQMARESTLKLATWGGDAAQTSQYMGTRIADQGLATERAKASMPEPLEFDYRAMLEQGFRSGGLAGFMAAAKDVQVASEQSRAAHEQAVRVMTEMENESRSVDQTTPRFVVPPDATSDDSSAMHGLMMRSPMATATGAPTSSSPDGAMMAMSAGGVPTGQSGTPISSPSGFSGGGVPVGGGPVGVPGGIPGGGGGVPQGGFGYNPAAASAGPSNFNSPQLYTPPNIQVPDVPNLGTSTSGYTPPTIPGTGGGYPNDSTHRGVNYTPPNPNLPGGTYTPYNPNLTGSKNPTVPPSYTPGTTPPGYVPPKVPNFFSPLTGDPNAPRLNYAGGGIPTGGASSGGFVPRGMGGGAGFSSPGGAAGIGAYAAEEAAMRGGNNAAAARAGAAGAPGMGMGPMGGAQRGEEDKEHRSKYATGEKIVEEPGRMVPLVIGEKTAKQHREERQDS